MKKKFISVDDALIDVYSIEAIGIPFTHGNLNRNHTFIITLASGEKVNFHRYGETSSLRELIEIRSQLITEITRMGL